MTIRKSEGTTPTEKLLADLCEKTFLKLWSYPNPFKDDRKELCDVLVVFENHVLIFFDRANSQLEKLDRDPLVSWGRWKKNSIDAQISTAKGAERYLRSARKVYLDGELKVPFPIPIQPEQMIVHKIVVAHGANEACKNWSENNVSGSLAMAYSAQSEDQLVPFFIELEKCDPVHVLDSHNLPILLSELDTVFDFTTYLDEKVRAISKFDLLSYAGEEDLLANYFLNFDKSRNRHFIGSNDETINGVMVAEGEWQSFLNRDAYRLKKAADKESYFLDELIQRTCQNAFDGVLGGNANVMRGKSAIHELAKEPRFHRREMASCMKRSILEFPDSPAPIMRNISFMPSFDGTKGYVFLQLKVDNPGDYENEYRPRRRALLEIACGAAMNKLLP